MGEIFLGFIAEVVSISLNFGWGVCAHAEDTLEVHGMEVGFQSCRCDYVRNIVEDSVNGANGGSGGGGRFLAKARGSPSLRKGFYGEVGVFGKVFRQGRYHRGVRSSPKDAVWLSFRPGRVLW